MYSLFDIIDDEDIILLDIKLLEILYLNLRISLIISNEIDDRNLI